jgi:hypothetical protein
MNLDLDAAVVKRRIQISKLEEMRLKAYENVSIYKERIKRNSNKEIRSSSTIRGLKPSERGNCKASGTDLILFIQCSHYGAMTIMDVKGDKFMVSGEWLKVYYELDVVPLHLIYVFTMEEEPERQD